jgi:7-cyano-7-deazaguanine synthase
VRPRPRGGSVVLLSGGMDSATCLALAVRRGGPVHALSFAYGQRHARELRSARALARRFGVKAHRLVRLPLGPLVDSSLTSPRRPLPSRGGRPGAIPSTYVPARNTVLLAVALGYAESHGLDTIYFGANAVDYSGYPDCRPEYVRAFNALARRAVRSPREGGHRIRVVAPLLSRSKAEIVRLGRRLGVPWELTWSCYHGGPVPCGKCDACRLRARGFRAAGVADPVLGPRSRPRSPAR